MLLVCGIKILISSETCQTQNDLAENLLKKFIMLYSSLYGEHLISYNVHSLLHLPMYVKIHGALDTFSCFKYENYLQELKKTIKCAKYPLQEMYNRIIEKQNIFLSESQKEHTTIIILKEINNIHSTLKSSDTLIEKIMFEDLKIVINVSQHKDKFVCLKNNDLIVICHIIKNNITNDITLSVQKFLNYTPFFISPIDSTIIHSYMVNTNLISNIFTISYLDIKSKCISIPIASNKAIISELSHSFFEN